MTARPRRRFVFGAFDFEPDEARLTRAGRPVFVPAKALAVLDVLVTRAGRLVTRQELLDAVWPGAFVEDSNITVHIGTLRRALEDGGEAIVTVPGTGYRFTAPVTEYVLDRPVDGAARPARRHRLVIAAAATLALTSAPAVWFVIPSASGPALSAHVTVLENHRQARCCGAAVVLDDGRVLAAAGVGISPNVRVAAAGLVYKRTAVLMDLAAGTTAGTNGSRVRRESPTATRLADGRVLLAGGYGCLSDGPGRCSVTAERRPLESAEIFDPATGAFQLVAGGMRAPHAGHTATRLDDGTVLIVGGYHGPDATSEWGTVVELFDPVATGGRQFRLLEPISQTLAGSVECGGCDEVRKADHTATRLPDGSVLIAGGWRGAGSARVFGGALRYRPGAPGLTLASPSGRPFVGAASATATLLGDGRVLFAGGARDFGVAGSLEPVLPATSIYDPVSDAQEDGPPMSTARVGHTATRVAPDTVVIAGGMSCAYSVARARLRGPHDPERAACDASATADIVTFGPRGHAVATFAMASGHAYHSAVLIGGPALEILIDGGLLASGTPTFIVERIRLARD